MPAELDPVVEWIEVAPRTGCLRSPEVGRPVRGGAMGVPWLIVVDGEGDDAAGGAFAQVAGVSEYGMLWVVLGTRVGVEEVVRVAEDFDVGGFGGGAWWEPMREIPLRRTVFRDS